MEVVVQAGMTLDVFGHAGPGLLAGKERLGSYRDVAQDTKDSPGTVRIMSLKRLVPLSLTSIPVDCDSALH